jgi:hypothetical protein
MSMRADSEYTEDDGHQHSGAGIGDPAPARSGTSAAAPAAGRENDHEFARERPAAQAAPLTYTDADEPLALGQFVDYRYLYELVRARFTREEDRGKSLDAKFAVLLTGVVASIGFSFRTTITPVTAAVTILYLIPLFLIAFGYTTKIGEDAPSIESLEESFPFYPISTLREAIKAMRMANAVNHRVHDQKASRFDWAFTATLIVTAAALIVQFLSSVGLFDGWKASHIAVPPTPTAASSTPNTTLGSRASNAANLLANLGRHDVLAQGTLIAAGPSHVWETSGKT